jgi:ketosteroid isomerase-like protein
MAEAQSTADELAGRVRTALESADLTAIRDLLDPNVRWGAPDDPAPSCQNRDQVLAWYQRGREAGVRAQVTDMVVEDNKILVGLTVIGTGGALSGEQGGPADRWQVLTVRGGRVVDIRGFDDREEARSRAGISDPG